MSKLKIGIQKSGKLYNGSIDLLNRADIKFDQTKNQLIHLSKNFPLEIYFLRNSDIPKYVEDGVLDIAIIGNNQLLENGLDIKITEKLGFSKCRLSLAIPKEKSFSDIGFFENKLIATSYPKSTKFFFNDLNISVRIHKISGSVEIAPNIGLADGICDLVSTGSTLENNGLKEVALVLESEAVLIESARVTDEKQSILNELLFRIRSITRAVNKKYILFNILNKNVDDIILLLPVLKSPTILKLKRPGWSSVHAVIDKEKFWQIVSKIKEKGAQDILVMPIENIIS